MAPRRNAGRGRGRGGGQAPPSAPALGGPSLAEPQEMDFDAENVSPDGGIALNLDNLDGQGFRTFIRGFITNPMFDAKFLTKERAKVFLRTPISAGSLKYFDVYMSANGKRIGLRFLASNLYLFGFQAQPNGVWYQLEGWLCVSRKVKLDVKNLYMVQIGLGVDYTDLERNGRRINLDLGICELTQAVYQLSKFAGGFFYHLRRPFLVIAQMVPEAMRQPAILEEICAKFYGCRLSPSLIKTQNQYGMKCRFFTARSIHERLDLSYQMSIEEYEEIELLLELTTVRYQSREGGYFWPKIYAT
ncbi:rRNA N-glycosidase [Striga asiatica]|uniref:rRNA N-glycosylase n=1 Tax=Striga asiatica TaxID=4170 RepID=A0A5A7QKK6_STRAF|nr:rRNA N-glycosidase [Striga asiatica]